MSWPVRRPLGLGPGRGCGPWVHAAGVLAVAAALLAHADRAWADVTLASVFGDHMVLQRGVPVRVWGHARPGEAVTVRLAGNRASTTAAADGTWHVELPPLEAGGPHQLTVRGDDTVRLRDVLVGEVWLCSGQSNMEWTVRASRDARSEIAAARDADIRHLKVPHRVAGEPLEDLQASWVVCSPDTAGEFTACGYFMARALHKALRVPVGLLNASWGGTRIEPWMPPESFHLLPSLGDLARQVEASAGRPPVSHQQPCVLYHGMLHALVGFPIRGVIWYQGESNHQEGLLYADKQEALIRSWRARWGIGELPFHYVQIAPFRYGNEAPEVLPAFWEAQAAVLGRVAHTGMVVTSDVATVEDIHPPDKQTVGERLARLALNRVHGEAVADSGPTFRALEVLDGSLRVRFDHAEGLGARDRRPLTHFEVAGVGTGFQPAEARVEGDAVVLVSKEVPAPCAVRFAWHKLAQPNLVNGAGLPAGAFRAGEVPRPDVLARLEEARGYTLVYDLDLANLSSAPRYDVDASASLGGGYDRVAYLLELQPSGGASTWVWVSMDAFTADPTRLGVPTASSGTVFQQAVHGLSVVTNAEGVAAGTDLEGNIEFWPSNYGPANGGQVPGASEEVWDVGDQPSGPPEGYGCMQVHVSRARQTLFAINHWSLGGAGADVGIGNSALDPRATDWTFAANGGRYLHKRLRVFVRLRAE